MAGLPSFAPPGLAAQLDSLVGGLNGVEAAVRALLAYQQGAEPDPVADALHIPVSSLDLSGGSYQTSDYLTIVAVQISATITGRYTLVRSNDASFHFYLQANAPTFVLSPPGRLSVSRGIVLSLNTPNNAAWEMNVWAIPGDYPQ